MFYDDPNLQQERREHDWEHQQRHLTAQFELKMSQSLIDFAAFAKVEIVSRRRLEVVFAAVRTLHGITDLVHGAQVEDEMLFGFDWLVAVLAYELQSQIRQRFKQLTVTVMFCNGKHCSIG